MKTYSVCPACNGENPKCEVCGGWGRTEKVDIPYHVMKALRKEYCEKQHELSGMTQREYITRRFAEMVYGYF